MLKRAYYIDMLNDKYFEKIDSYEKAYYLGLLYADGCVTNNINKSRYRIQISLTEKDSYILNDLNKSLLNNKKMFRYIYPDKRGKPARVLYANSKKLVNDLIKLGCEPRKSLILKFPKINQFFKEKYMNAFLRGYFDGDGECSFYLPRLQVRITSSHDFCDGFAKFIKRKFGENCYVANRGKFSTVAITTKLNKIKFYHYIYKNSEMKICLKRKKDNFEKVFTYLEDLQKRKGLSIKQQKILKLGKIIF